MPGLSRRRSGASRCVRGAPVWSEAPVKHSFSPSGCVNATPPLWRMPPLGTVAPGSLRDCCSGLPPENDTETGNYAVLTRGGPAIAAFVNQVSPKSEPFRFCWGRSGNWEVSKAACHGCTADELFAQRNGPGPSNGNSAQHRLRDSKHEFSTPNRPRGTRITTPV